MADSNKITALSNARRAAWLPFFGAVLIVAIVVALTGLLSVGHIGVVANTLAVTLCLLPLLILMAPLVIGVFAGIWGLSKADKAAVRRLLQAEHAAGEAKQRVQEGSRAAGQRFIGLAEAIERLAPLWDIFDSETKAKGRDDAAQSAKPE